MSMGKIHLKRDSGYADQLRLYKILIDGKPVGGIGDGEEKTFEVESGTHTLQLKIDWGKSNPVKFDLRSGEMIRFTCASRARGLKVLLAIAYATVLSQRYIKLERTN